MFPLFLFIYGMSGAAFLGAETIWIREMELGAGSAPWSAAWIMAVFFIFAGFGSKAGAWLAHRVSRPAAIYGILEIATAASLVLVHAFREPAFGAWFQGRPWETAYAVYLAGAPSFLSGAALPLLAAAWVAPGDPAERSRRAGMLYGANLTGAALGAAVGGVFLPMHFGYQAAVWILALALFAAGATAVWAGANLRRAPESRTGRPGRGRRAASLEKDGALLSARATWAAAVMASSGALTLVTEILALGYFQVIATESLFAYAAVLLVCILGLAAGAFVAARWSPPIEWVLGAAALLLFAAPYVLWMLFEGREFLAADSGATHYARLGLFACAGLLPPLTVQGAVFPLAWAHLRRAAAPGAALGHFLFLNKAGAAAGVAAAGTLLLERLDLPMCFLAVGGAYALLCVGGWFTAGGHRAPSAAWAAALLLAAFAAAAHFRREPVALAPGERLLGRYQGRSGLVTVVEDALGSRHIRVNQTYTLNGTGSALAAQRMEGWLPFMFHAAPRRVLFIGMASGISADAALDFPVRDLVAVEISPEVLRAARRHFSPWNRRLFTDPRARIVVDDGRHVLQRTKGWDLVICDLFNPVRASASRMYSREFFRAAAARLAPGGRMVLWLAVYQFDEPMMGAVLRGFAEAFPNAMLVRANFDPGQPIVAAIGGAEPFNLAAEELEVRIAAAPPAVAAASPLFLRSAAHLRLAFMGDLQAPTISSYLASFPANTDDYPVIAFAGPKRFAPGTRLLGINLVRWNGTRFLSPVMPSCSHGATPPDALLAGQRAGNHCFAAAVMGVPLPGASPEKAAERARRMKEHLDTAAALAPDALVRMEDLGR